MPASGDPALPMEYVPSATKNRRGPKKSQNLGLEQFRHQGPAHNFLPGSAAALLRQKKVDQRVEAWLGRETPVDQVNGLKDEGRPEAESGNRDGITAGNATIIGDEDHGGIKRPDTVMATEATTLDETALKDVTKQKHKQDATDMDWQTLSQNKLLPRTNLTRHVKATAGSWGHCRIEDSRRAAQKATAAAYASTAVTIDAVDGDLIATVEPTQPVATKSTSRPIPIQPLNFTAMPTVHRYSAEATGKWARRNQIAMFSDESDDESQHQEDFGDRLLSSGSTMIHTQRPSPCRRDLTSQAENTPSLNLNKNKKTSRAEAIPQRRKVRFASPSPSTEEDKITDTINNDSTLFKQSPSSINLKENLDPGEISDDEDSELYQPSKLPLTLTPETTLPPDSQPWAYKPQPQPREQRQNPYPPRRKGTAAPPTPKRARAPSPESDHASTSDIDINDVDVHANKSSRTDVKPASKKARLDTHTISPIESQSSPENDQQEKKPAAPFRKKGIATKVVRRKR